MFRCLKEPNLIKNAPLVNRLVLIIKWKNNLIYQVIIHCKSGTDDHSSDLAVDLNANKVVDVKRATSGHGIARFGRQFVSAEEEEGNRRIDHGAVVNVCRFGTLDLGEEDHPLAREVRLFGVDGPVK